jgi:hypothetical protein
MKFRTLLLGLTALFVAFNAAFFSVSGLSKLFAGAAISVIIMASSLELAKLITAGYLYNYWDKINKSFRIYLSGAVLILILITSLGIYGFLTSAFQDTFNQFSIKEKQLAFLQQKEKFWGDDVIRYDDELKRISTNISTLSNAKSQSIQVRDTSVAGGIRTTISTSELRISQKRIEVEEQNRKGVQSKREVAADSLQTIQLKILDVESSEGVSSELGPLQYLSGLLDKPMDVIINWFILIIIFVFDPLAVALVIAFNNALKVDRGIDDKEKIVTKRELYGEEPEDDDSDELYNEEDEWNIETDGDSKIESLEETLDNESEDTELTSKEISKILEERENSSEPNEALKEIVSEFDLLKKDISRRGIDIDNDGTIDGYDNTGDGLIDELVPAASSRRAQYVLNEVPFYARPNFNWGDRSKWINNQNAVNYWLTYIKNEKDTNYPDDFTSKTY